MSTDRRRTPRWRTPDYQQDARIRHEDGKTSAATLLDVSLGGIGLRADRRRFAPGMRVRVAIDLLDETSEVVGAVRFVDRFFPRIGLQVDSPDLMAKVVDQAKNCGFLMSEVKGDTLMVAGRLTLATAKEFDAVRRYRKLDLSGVTAVSVAGAAVVSNIAGGGARIDCCSPAIAPVFESLGICRGRLCVSPTPCDLPKNWPSRRPAG